MDLTKLLLVGNDVNLLFLVVLLLLVFGPRLTTSVWSLLWILLHFQLIIVQLLGSCVFLEELIKFLECYGVPAE